MPKPGPAQDTELLVRGYERLREGRGQGPGGLRGAGYVLLVQRGLAAWIEAWSRCAPVPAPEGDSSSRSQGASPGPLPDRLPVPAGLYPVVVRQLAELVRGPLKELLR